tara:strand:- start:2063 stop:2293 length:231 start_codon:yes stop_codon:yes gene_type:complete
MNKSDIEKIVCSIINREKLDYSEPLISSSLLDSFSILVLISKLEMKFDIKINLEGIDLEKLDTINLIYEFLIQNND